MVANAFVEGLINREILDQVSKIGKFMCENESPRPLPNGPSWTLLGYKATQMMRFNMGQHQASFVHFSSFSHHNPITNCIVLRTRTRDRRMAGASTELWRLHIAQWMCLFVCLCDQNDGNERTILALTSQRYEAQAEMDERWWVPRRLFLCFQKVEWMTLCRRQMVW